MTASIPAKKANELIDSINEMLEGGINNDRIEEIIAEANKMKGFGLYTDAYNVLGMIAALRADTGEVERLFTAALHSGGRDAWTLSNYASALSNLDRLSEAVKIIDEVVDGAPDDLSVIKQAIKLHHDAFDVKGVRELMACCEKLGQPFDSRAMDRMLDLTEALMAEHSVMWTEVASRVELASGVLHRLGLIPQNVKQVTPDGIMVYEYKIHGDINLVAQVENAINDAIAEKDYSPVDDFLYLTCSTI